jgi:hypothetical protein
VLRSACRSTRQPNSAGERRNTATSSIGPATKKAQSRSTRASSPCPGASVQPTVKTAPQASEATTHAEGTGTRERAASTTDIETYAPPAPSSVVVLASAG